MTRPQRHPYWVVELASNTVNTATMGTTGDICDCIFVDEGFSVTNHFEYMSVRLRLWENVCNCD